MNRATLQPDPAPPASLPLPLGEGRGEGASPRPAFTLVELLVVVSIILLLMGMFSAAVAAARGSYRKQATQALIARLDTIIQQHYATFATRTVSGSTAAIVAASRRQMATADMPNSWAEVQTLKAGTTGLVGDPSRKFPLNASQRAYVRYRDAISPPPTSQFEDAECLFMIVMIGGIADCIDCGGLTQSQVGDKDNDKAPEFWDAWGNPIGFILWPAGLELPPGSGRYFSSTAPFGGGVIAAAPGGIMRPVIYSRGRDGSATLGVPNTSQLATGVACGDPTDGTVAKFGGFAPPSGDPADRRADNITNFDAEANR